MSRCVFLPSNGRKTPSVIPPYFVRYICDSIGSGCTPLLNVVLCEPNKPCDVLGNPSDLIYESAYPGTNWREGLNPGHKRSVWLKCCVFDCFRLSSSLMLKSNEDGCKGGVMSCRNQSLPLLLWTIPNKKCTHMYLKCSFFVSNLVREKTRPICAHQCFLCCLILTKDCIQ